MDEQIWKGLLERYGQRLELRREGETAPVRAFFQPVGEKKDGSVPTPAGTRPEGKWLYLGPADVQIREGDAVVWQGGTFLARRAREIAVGESVLYRWAIFEEADRGDEP